METTLRFYELPLKNIPFSSIPSLEKCTYKSIICSELLLHESDEKCIISVYNLFDIAPEIEYLDDENLLFGKVLSERLPRRGVNKCNLISEQRVNIDKFELPHLRYTSKVRDSPEGNWFYTNNGDYHILSAIETEYSKAKHLESISIYGDWVIRLRVVIELLKRNEKIGLINLNINQLKEIAFNVMRNEPSLSKLNDAALINGVNNWIPSMMITPLISDIPLNQRGKVLN
ncbi:hypothetical protein [Lacihabitans sp. CS3-21]|uniref:hypothetical protein n=1 Tax=Lacihabitans sp. CS3-21 TaxID=2487332 RepID=UPI0020CEE6B5|nr:hypothetical protein [Lacihabitans sp. CS3-21]MCP9747819.1 hypothetical protein [Lacihabitans sp. CS3-21]